ncbi:MAG TPA: hypothetical protein VF516_34815, partial [Kofleriaceae bacterium]
MVRSERERERREDFFGSGGRLLVVGLVELRAADVRPARFTAVLGTSATRAAAFVVGRAAARTAAVIVAVTPASRRAVGFGVAGFG